MIDVIHRTCRGVAFKYSHVPSISEVVDPNEAEGVNGESFVAGQPMVCGTCKKPIFTVIGELIINE